MVCFHSVEDLWYNVPGLWEGNPVVKTDDFADNKVKINLGDIFPIKGDGSGYIYYRSEDPWEMFTFVRAKDVKEEGSNRHFSLTSIFPSDYFFQGTEYQDECRIASLYMKVDWDDTDLDNRDRLLCVYGSQIPNLLYGDCLNDSQTAMIEEIIGKGDIKEQISGLRSNYYLFRMIRQDKLNTLIAEDETLIVPLKLRLIADGNCGSYTSFNLFNEIVADDYAIADFLTKKGDFDYMFVYGKEKKC